MLGVVQSRICTFPIICTISCYFSILAVSLFIMSDLNVLFLAEDSAYSDPLSDCTGDFNILQFLDDNECVYSFISFKKTLST